MKRDKQVIIHHNHELPEITYAVCKFEDPEFWIDAFEKKEDVIAFCDKKEYMIVKWKCSVDCLDCPSPGPETAATVL